MKTTCKHQTVDLHLKEEGIQSTDFLREISGIDNSGAEEADRKFLIRGEVRFVA